MILKIELAILATSLLLCSCQNEECLEIKEKNVNKGSSVEKCDPVKVNSFEVNRVIKSYLKGNGKNSSRADEAVITSLGSDPSESLYVVNFSNDNGFLILSSSKNCNPILAFSDKGSFNLDVTENGANLWKEEALKTMKYLNDNPEDNAAIRARNLWRKYENHRQIGNPHYSNGNKSRYDDHMEMPSSEEMQVLELIMADSVNHWATMHDKTVYTLREYQEYYPYDYEQLENKVKEIIYPGYQGAYDKLTYIVVNDKGYHYEKKLIQTTWNQYSIENRFAPMYNKFFPSVGNLLHAYTGCTTVAAAQLMYYYNWPESYNWSSMLLAEPTDETARLMYDLSKASNPKYAEDRTTISLPDMRNTLIANGYSADYKSSFSATNAISNVWNYKPVIISSKLYDKNGKYVDAHAWLLAGMMENYYNEETEIWTFLDYRYFYYTPYGIQNPSTYRYYYCNWGAGGTNDGWFSDFSSVCPSSYKKTTSYEMLWNITPNK